MNKFSHYENKNVLGSNCDIIDRVYLYILCCVQGAQAFLIRLTCKKHFAAAENTPNHSDHQTTIIETITTTAASTWEFSIKQKDDIQF